MNTDFSRLQRPRYPMPPEVHEVLEGRGLIDAYRTRPAYQQNDYLRWISSAKRPQTRARRLAQMIMELERGGVYMRMPHPPSEK